MLTSWSDAGHCRAIAAETGHVDGLKHNYSAGRLAADENSAQVQDDSIFLIASPTKPFVATAAMLLVERGELQLDHFVCRYLPDFRGHGKQSVRLIHLLTHTSGLPDMLPNNETLRKQHAPLSTYMQHVNETRLLAKPGRLVHYQSMGILALAQVIETVTGTNIADFLSAEIFSPLEMNDEDSSKGVAAARKVLEQEGLTITDENIFIAAACRDKGIRFLKGEAQVGVRKVDKQTAAPVAAPAATDFPHLPGDLDQRGGLGHHVPVAL